MKYRIVDGVGMQRDPPFSHVIRMAAFTLGSSVCGEYGPSATGGRGVGTGAAASSPQPNASTVSTQRTIERVAALRGSEQDGSPWAGESGASVASPLCAANGTCGGFSVNSQLREKRSCRHRHFMNHLVVRLAVEVTPWTVSML